MTRVVWYSMVLGVVLVIVAAVSWVMAYTTINDVLGAPPPEMGSTTVAFLWSGMPRKVGHPKAWVFSFGPTLIPGAPKVRFYVSPTGKLLQTEPAGLPAMIKAMHAKGFN